MKKMFLTSLLFLLIFIVPLSSQIDSNQDIFNFDEEEISITLNRQFSGGTGTPENPWQISSLDELNLLRDYIGESHRDKHFILMNDLTFPESPGEPYYNWTPISIDLGFYTNQPFFGNLDGNNHTIYNLFIDQSDTIQYGYAGLFAVLRDASVSNLNFENANIIGGPSSTGVLAGSVTNSTITNSHSSGVISGISTTGGLLGSAYQSSIIENCSSEVVVENTGWPTGGLIGSISNSIIISSVSTGSVSGSSLVGGLIGSIASGGVVDNSYATGDIIGQSNTGGLAGSSHGLIFASYATGSVDGFQNVGGLVGLSGGSIYNSYASGNVLANNFNCGGLVGLLFQGVISNSFSGNSTVYGTAYVGGLVGRSLNSSISSSYAFGVTSGFTVGGLVGESVSTSISNSYSRGSVNGNSMGGLVGLLDSGYVLNSYTRTQTTSFSPNSGGLIGAIENYPEIISSYWNTDNPNWVDNELGEGRTTDEMTYPFGDNTYVGWDFINIWSENIESNINQGYPYQLWQEGVSFFYPPTNLTAETDDGTIYLFWDTPETELPVRMNRNLQGYNIFRGSNLLNDELILETEFTDNDVSNGINYMYYVVAVYEAGESIPSNTVFAIPGIPEYLIVLTINPVNSGTVTGYEQTYIAGELVTLEAFPFTEWTFVNWTYSEEVINETNTSRDNYSLRDVFSDENPVSFEMPENNLYLTANFEPTVYFAGGSGSEDDPWQISTAEELYTVRHYLGEDYLDQYFMLINNINLDQYPYNSGEGWEPIGNSDHRFYGNFDGNGYVVENLFIDRPTLSVNGLFGFIEEGHIENLGVTNIEISGGLNTGGLVARLNGGTIDNCFAIGTIIGGNNTGGLAGSCANGALIINSYSSGYIFTNSDRVGGLVGFLDNSEIIGSFTVVEVVGDNNVGGLVGLIHDNSLVNNSFTHGSVYGLQRAGGLIGRNSQSSSISFSYSNSLVEGNHLTGGLVGAGTGQGPTINSYWNLETSGQSTSVGGTGKTTAEMTFPYSDECFLDWDFENMWSVNQGYPYLEFYTTQISELPHQAVAIMPYDQSYFTNVLPKFRWKPILSEKNMNPTGFLISLGTDNPPTNIVYNEDIGWRFSHILDFELELNQQYFWQIIPYNDIGQALDNPVWSFTNYSFAGGSGTQSDPWEVETVEHLSNLREFLGSSNNDKYFIQTADICLDIYPWNEGEGWEPIGSQNSRFHGNYDGDGFVINGLYINRPNSDNQGLFGFISGASIINTGVINADVTGNTKVGSLAGLSDFSSFIANCYSRGVVHGHTEVGGLVGSNSRSEITKSFSTARVNAGWRNAGGLAGTNSWQTAEISQSFSKGEVNGSQYIGGLVGASNGGIIDCYSVGVVNGNHNVGGLLGNGYGTVNSYWNTELSGQSNSAGGDGAIGRTTEEMSFPYDDNTYLEWNFSEVWVADEDHTVNNGYPYLSSINVIVYLPSPENLSATSESGGVNLTWDFSLISETNLNRQDLQFIGFNVYRDGEIVNPEPVLENEYDDYNVSIGTEYTYYVIATYNQGESSPSNAIQITALGDFHSIYVTIYPEDTGTVTGAEGEFYEGQTVILEAIPETGLVFYNWTYTDMNVRQQTERNIFSEENPVTFTMPANDLHLTANFGDGSGFAGGFGTAENPWQITNLDELNLLRNYVGEIHNDKYFVLMNDLYFPDSPNDPYYIWIPISNEYGLYTNLPFQGNFDGNNCTIFNMFVDQSDAVQNSYAGLFSVLTDANISNLNLENVSILGGPWGSGGLAGSALNSNIINCHSTGNITGSSSTGGLIGSINDFTTLDNCSSDVVVYSTGWPSGGLVGSVDNSIIINSSSSSNVTGSNSVGGLVGSLSSDGIIENSYASSEVNGETFGTGGLVGYSAGLISFAYASGHVYGFQNVGGLVGHSVGSINGSYASGHVNATHFNCGGLVGRLSNNGLIENSYSVGSQVNGVINVGGLVGSLNDATISRSYAFVSTDGLTAGGLVGESMSGTILNSYSKGIITGGSYLGGLVGFKNAGILNDSFAITELHAYSSDSGGLIGGIDNNPTITASYWNTDNPYWLQNDIGEGRTTDEMTYPYAVNTYVNWDFNEIWLSDQHSYFNDGYPFLHWEYSEAEMLPPPVNLVALWGLGYVNLTWDPPSNQRNMSRVNINSLIRNKTLFTDNKISDNIHYRENYELLGYNIYRDNTQINLSIVTQTEYTDYEVTGGLDYSYHVTAVYSLGESIPSQTVSAFPPEIVINELPWFEDFSSTQVNEIPLGWRRTHSNWGVIDTDNAGGEIPEIRFHLIPTSAGLFRLISPMIDVSAYNSLELKFKHALDYLTEEFEIRVEISSDLSSWENIWSVNVSYDIEPEIVELNLQTFDENMIYISWVFNGNSWNIMDWFIDDIELEGFYEYEILPPLNLEAFAGDGYVELFWEEPAWNTNLNTNNQENHFSTITSRENYNFIGYNVYRDWYQINTQPLTETHYTDNYVQNDITYYYYVTALYEAGESEPSNDIYVTPGVVEFAGGSGTQSDPWQILTLEHLWNINNYLGDDHSDKYFELSNNIYFESRFDLRDRIYFDEGGWIPIAIDYTHPFKGNFNGNNYVIDGLYINRPNSDFQGLFGYIEGASIANLGLTNVDVTGAYYVGALVGNSYWDTLITNCFSTGFVSGEDSVGGLIGSKGDGSSLDSSFSECIVYGDYFVGGLIGTSYYVTLSNSYSRGDVTGDAFVGGLIGLEGSSQISNCFSTGSVLGGFATGGLIGYTMGSWVENSYWDTQSSGMNISDGGEGRTTEEMTYPYSTNTFVDWDFNIVWHSDENYLVNDGHPYHQWFQAPQYLSPPTNLVAEIDNGMVILSWQPPTIVNVTRNKIVDNLALTRQTHRNLLGYNVYRDNYQINSETVAETTYTDGNVEYGLEYIYYVTAVYDQGESLPSNAVEVFFGSQPEEIIISLSSHVLQVGESFLLNISVSEILEEWAISSYGFQLFHDPEIIEFIGIPVEEFSTTLSAPGGMPVYNDMIGHINFGWAHFLPIITDGDVLLVLGFEAVGPGETDVSLDNFIFNTIEITNIEPSNIEVMDFLYGDINRDGVVTPLDASIILQYYVGFDPIPEIDPIPWSNLSVMIADVDLDGQILPLDASIILQYYVGLIEELPVLPSRNTRQTKSSVEVIYQSGYLNFYSEETVLGLGIEVLSEDLSYIGNPVFSCSDWIIAQNTVDSTYKIALARAQATSRNNLILSIPVESIMIEQVELNLDINNQETKRIVINTLATEYCSTPVVTKLWGNYPNPFNPDTNIEFSLKDRERVVIEVYNIKGQKIRTLIDEEKLAGNHTLVWNGRDDTDRPVGSGIFFYRMKTENYNEVKKMILLK